MIRHLEEEERLRVLLFITKIRIFNTTPKAMYNYYYIKIRAKNQDLSSQIEPESAVSDNSEE